ncbi:MAG: tetratricopeptide repeat protein [Verrucomicrobiota bacterium]|nr:tetratricopeptide repeat protein [Limisphaera sp.]MDW8380741.1 tetratricopeptide repeat protein [Verrucomicrobiota bacterium]
MTGSLEMITPRMVLPSRFSLFARAGAVLFLALGTSLLYELVGAFDFVNFDDPDYVAANPMVQSGVNARSLQWAFGSFHASNWHPLTWISHMLDCQWFGLNPGAHHRVNVFWHAFNAAVLYGWLGFLTGRWLLAWWVAAFWAWHPLRVESVAWIAERKDVLSLAFGLGCLWAYTIAVRHHIRGRRTAWVGWMSVSWLFLGLGLMAKPMLVTLPCVMLLLDFWPLRRWPGMIGVGPEPAFRGVSPESIRRLLLEKLPFFALSLASSVVTLLAQSQAGATVPLEALPLSTRLAQVCVSYASYLGKTIWPVRLAPFYPYEPKDWSDPAVGMGCALLGFTTFVVVLTRRSAPWVVTGWFWFLGTLVPVIGLVQVGQQAMADRYTYLPQIGLVWAVAWALGHRLRNHPGLSLVTMIGAALALIGTASLTRSQLSHWRNSRTLAEHTLHVTARNYLAHTQLANALLEEGRLAEALRECARALELRPHYAEAHNVRANILYRQGDWTAARQAFEQALVCNPSLPDAWHGLALVLLKQQHWSDAARAAQRALELWPLHMGALFALAQAHHQAGDWEAAAAAYRRLSELKPDSAAAFQGLGAVLALQGNLPAACEAYEHALSLRPHDPEIHLRLGVLRLQLGQSVLAEKHLRFVLQELPDHALAHLHMGHLSLGQAQREAAIEHYRKALPHCPDDLQLLNNLAWLLATHPNENVRNGGLAVELAERAVQLTQERVPLLLGTLAAAYAEVGRFTDAIQTAEKAVAQAIECGQTDLARRNEELLRLYRSGRAPRE